MLKTNKFKDMKRTQGLYVNLISVLFIIASFITVIRIWMINRSFWVDEAMLVWSFNTDSLWDILRNGLAWDQSAPLGYVAFIKLFIKIFGNTEMALRVTSIFAFLLMLLLVYLICKKIFNFEYPLICVAFISCNQILLQYTNEFKPYMLDCFLVLLTIYLFFLYKKGLKDRWWIVCNIFIIIFSNPACFMLAAILMYDFFLSLKKNNKQEVIHVFKIGLLFLATFLIYYFLWLQKTATNEYMIQYWEEKKLPIFPTNFEKLGILRNLLLEIFNVWGINKGFIASLSILSLIISVIKRNRYILISFIALLIAGIASNLGFFPIAVRLWLFIYPLLSIIAFVCLSELLHNTCKKTAIIVLFIMFTLVLQNTGLQCYANIDVAYYKGEEANNLIKYVKENIKENETLYISYWGIPALAYKNGYTSNCIGETTRENIIRGTREYDFMNDFSKIIESDNCYIILYHEDRRNILIENLKPYGYVETILIDHETYLFYFTSDINHIKTHADYEIHNVATYNNICHFDVTLVNKGKAYINTDYVPAGIRCRNSENIIIDIPQFIKPAESVTFHCSFDWGQIKEFELEFASSQYWYSEINISPFSITKNNSYEEALEHFQQLATYLCQGYTILFSGKDDFSASWNSEFQQIFAELGFKSNLKNAIQYSYIGIIDNGNVVYEYLSNKKLEYLYKKQGYRIKVLSQGLNCGNLSSIQINGTEYSLNSRGLNIVIYNNQNKILIDSFSIDTNLTYLLKTLL
ncbi:glycosyltransferase family 39 protein [Lachnospiraceae bacterium 47-T17]